MIDGLKSSGFLLIDEANDPLTQDIKNIDNEIYLDQFGQGGTQDIKLRFTCLTSTHSGAVRGMSDEMYNRLLLVELPKSEVKHTLDKSDLFLHDTERYTKALTDYAMWVLKDALVNEDYTKQTLKELQDKYRLELNSDVDDILSEASEHIVTACKSLASASGDLVLREGEYFIKRKRDIQQMVTDRLGEYSHIDVEKYSEELVTHFVGDQKSIRVDGKPRKYYTLNLKKYYGDGVSEEEKVVDLFDDLDLDEL